MKKKKIASICFTFTDPNKYPFFLCNSNIKSDSKGNFKIKISLYKNKMFFNAFLIISKSGYKSVNIEITLGGKDPANINLGQIVLEPSNGNFVKNPSPPSKKFFYF